MNEHLDVRAGAALMWREVRRNWLHLAVALVFGLFWACARLALPVLAGITIDDAIAEGRRGLLLALVGAVFGVVMLQGLSAAVRRYFAMRTSYRIEADLRAALYNRVNRLSFDYYDRVSTGQLMSRGSTDLHEVQNFIVVIPLNTAFLIMAVGAFIILLTMHWLLAILAMLAYPIVTLITIHFFNRLFPATARLQQNLGNLTSIVEENIAGVRLIRAFGRTRHEEARLRRSADQIYDDSMEVARLRTLYTPLFLLLPALGQLVVLSFGGWLVLEGQVSTGEFVAFFYFLNILVWPVQFLGEMIAGAQRAFTSAARVWNIIREDPTVQEAEHPESLPDGGRGEIVFDHVEFAYGHGAPVLHDLSLHAEAGKAVALVGPTGCGKSTVGRLLPRFYDVDSGSVTIDGVDVRNLRLDELRRNVGLVFEDTFLFSDSIRNNIAYGRLDATDEEIEGAARLAQAAEFIEAMPEGYDTVVGEQGFSLSGGQRQRIAIARAVLMQPRVLILDDATSSVDARMEEEIRDALKRVMAGRTTIIISHRISTIALADEVLLLEEGRIVERGIHEELMRESARYRDALGQREAAA